ncbi:hypothetical protein PG993_004949 [Apiospora rasikravindrae]|uniref:Uncharacterized protein n=1 Tax=Apiospora rasikravindrae TaxID=990691 RepID=A0ABR1TE82_9PEZI
MFTIGNAAANQAFNHSGVVVDPTIPQYKELAAKYNYVRDPLLSQAEDINFQDFIRRKIMEKAAKDARKKEKEEEEQDRAAPNGNNNGNAAVVPRGTTGEPKKKSRRSLKKALGFFFLFLNNSTI